MDRRGKQLLTPAALDKQKLLSRIVPAAQGMSGKQLAEGTEAPAHQERAPNAPLVDFPEGHVLDPLNLLNVVERHCMGEEFPDLSKLL